MAAVVVVTGATGLLGSHAALHLARRPSVVSVLCPVRPHTAGLPSADQRLCEVVSRWPRDDAAVLGPKLRAVAVDFAATGGEAAALRSVVAAAAGDFGGRRPGMAPVRCTGVVHCAALDGYRFEPALLRRVNVGGTTAMLAAASALRVPLVHASSCAARLFDGEPAPVGGSGFRTDYAASKALAERAVVSRCEVAVDIGYLYEDGEGVEADETNIVECIWRLCARVGAAPRLASDEAVLDHTHVSDAAAALVALVPGGNEDCVGGHISSRSSSRSSGVGRALVLRSAASSLSWNRDLLPALLAHGVAELPLPQWRAAVLAYCAQRGTRLRWLADLISADLEQQLRTMFPHPSQILQAPWEGRVSFRAVNAAARVTRALASSV